MPTRLQAAGRDQRAAGRAALSLSPGAKTLLAELTPVHLGEQRVLEPALARALRRIASAVAAPGTGG